MRKHSTVRRSFTGRRIGESHHRARLTSGDVSNIRALHEDGMGYGQIAEKFEIARSTVQRICNGSLRAYD